MSSRGKLPCHCCHWSRRCCCCCCRCPRCYCWCSWRVFLRAAPATVVDAQATTLSISVMTSRCSAGNSQRPSADGRATLTMRLIAVSLRSRSRSSHGSYWKQDRREASTHKCYFWLRRPTAREGFIILQCIAGGLAFIAANGKSCSRIKL